MATEATAAAIGDSAATVVASVVGDSAPVAAMVFESRARTIDVSLAAEGVESAGRRRQSHLVPHPTERRRC